jgi:hypothetical protein
MLLNGRQNVVDCGHGKQERSKTRSQETEEEKTLVERKSTCPKLVAEPLQPKGSSPLQGSFDCGAQEQRAFTQDDMLPASAYTAGRWHARVARQRSRSAGDYDSFFATTAMPRSFN